MNAKRECGSLSHQWKAIAGTWFTVSVTEREVTNMGRAVCQKCGVVKDEWLTVPRMWSGGAK